LAIRNRQREKEGIGRHHDVPVPVLARDLDLAGYAGERLDPVPGNAAGMVARAAGDDVDILDAGEHLRCLGSQRIGDDPAALDTPVQRVRERARLLEYLFQHEVPVGTLLGRISTPLCLVHLALNGLAVRVEDVYLAAGDLRDVALFEVDEALRHRQQRRHAARDEVFTDAETDDQRARNSAHDDAVGVLRVDDQQGKSAAETSNRFRHRFDQVASFLQVIVDEVCRYLGVGLGYEFVALCLELVLDLLVVLDDPVVNDRNAITGHVGVSIGLGDAAVRCPAGVGDTQ
jgi:hypothetical protein